MKKILLILVIGMLLVACGGSDSDVDLEEAEQTCVDEGGTWVEEFNECEYISEDTCTDLGGTFDECASACRHEEGDVICTANCVPLCTFE